MGGQVKTSQQQSKEKNVRSCQKLVHITFNTEGEGREGKGRREGKKGREGITNGI